MADIARGLRFTVDLDSGLIVKPQTSELMQGDKNADRVIIQLERNRQPVDLTGVSVSGTFQRASGDIVPLTGTVSGSEVSLILGEHCYAETGAYEIQARLQVGGERRTVVVVTGRVRRKGDGRIIDVENVVPSLEDIFAQLDTMRAVTAEAQAATEAANEAAGNAERISSEKVGGYFPMITSSDRAEEAFGSDCDNMVPNTIYCIGKKLDIRNLPYENCMGTFINLNYSKTNSSGNAQICIDSNGEKFTRILFGGGWSDWGKMQEAEQVYYVGGKSGNPSFTQTLLDLKDNTKPKTIYVYGGEYDIFREYRTAGIPTPPAGTSTSDYFDYNAIVPLNTKIIGLGDVVLKWMPDSSEIDALSSKIQGPFNAIGSVRLENVTIRVKNGRYCIHDDGHNKNADTVHEYINVNCIYEPADSGYGLSNTTGFGFETRGRYLLDGCTFINNMTGHQSAFYGHGSTNSSGNPAQDSAEIVVKNCVFITGSDTSNRVVRLQSIATVREHIKTLIANTHIGGGVLLTQISSNPTAKNSFDVTILHSGNPEITVSDKNNQYPVKVY